MTVKKTALVLGSTGLVGKQLVTQLIDDSRYAQITCFVRRPLPQNFFSDPAKKCQPITIDFEQLQDYQGYFAADHIFVCLGTAIKKAGDHSKFRKVDFEYVHVAAQLARAQRAGSFVWISSVGANAGSGNFYLRVKGELENAIMGMSGLDNAAAVRPSLLLGAREELRFAEQVGSIVGRCLSPLLSGRLAKYKPIRASAVASQMIRFANV